VARRAVRAPAEVTVLAMKVRDIIKLLEQDGWYLKQTRGSHRQYKLKP
jgi:predicted RNA binding protein YcfA (HicA-like mRNA interferase family)